MKISSIDKNIKSILSSNYYTIPRFQRHYSWNEENIYDFWNDTIVDSDSDYFIGSIVVFESGADRYGIVDGQQRLSTITMVLCALRNAFAKEGESGLAQAVHQLIERPDIDNKTRFVLQTETSFPYFQEHIQKFGKPSMQPKVGEEEKDIAAAFERISKYIEDTVNSVKINPSLKQDKKAHEIQEKLVGIRDKILNLKVIFVQLDNEDDAYTIFETLNTRGKDLNVADLVKAYLTHWIPTKNAGVDTPKLLWNQVVETIEESSADLDIVVFIHHYWLSTHDYTTVKKLYKEIRKNIKKTNAKEFLDQLVNDSKIYREIHEVSFAKWKLEEQQIKDSLDAFTVFRIRQQVPMILSVMRDYRAGLLKKKDVQEILAAIEDFHFIFTAVTSQRSSGGISQMYASAAKILACSEKPDGRIKVLKDLRSKLKKKMPSFDEFIVDFREIKYSDYFTKQKKLVQYILCHAHRDCNPGISCDYSRMTIEHLASQNQPVGSSTDKEHIAQLGNLILVPDKLNSTKLGNKTFTEKRKILIDNKVSIDEIIQKASSWGNAEIDARTAFLADLAYNKIWKIH